jgi:hypothetical protein
MTISAEKKLGHGSVLKQTATPIAQLKKIQIPGYDRGEVDATTLDSTIQDFLPGDPPEITPIDIDAIWVGGLASQELIETSVRAKTNDTYVAIVSGWSTARTFTFTGYVTMTKPADVVSKDPMGVSYRIRPTSVVTQT